MPLRTGHPLHAALCWLRILHRFLVFRRSLEPSNMKYHVISSPPCAAPCCCRFCITNGLAHSRMRQLGSTVRHLRYVCMHVWWVCRYTSGMYRALMHAAARQHRSTPQVRIRVWSVYLYFIFGIFVFYLTPGHRRYVCGEQAHAGEMWVCWGGR